MSSVAYGRSNSVLGEVNQREKSTDFAEDSIFIEVDAKTTRKRNQSALEKEESQKVSAPRADRIKSSRTNSAGEDADAFETPSKALDPWCDPEKPKVISMEDIRAAEVRLRGEVLMTPCQYNHQLSEELGMEIYFKHEYLQATGSFKERGARNALSNLSTEQQIKGVIAASSGNHALGLSYHGARMGIPVTVCMPEGAPMTKILTCRKYGANVIVYGKDLESTKKMAMSLAVEKGYTYINGYDHPHVLAGQGTIGLEIAAQVGRIDAVIIPVGGGGLLAGAGLALKKLFPNVKIIGVESEACPSYAKALKEKTPTYTPPSGPTLADGLSAPVIGCNSLRTVTTHKIADKMVKVSETDISQAILRILESLKAVVEGAGAAGLAALLGGQLQELRGKKVVVILTGGNIDMNKLSRTIQNALKIREGSMA